MCLLVLIEKKNLQQVQLLNTRFDSQYSCMINLDKPSQMSNFRSIIPVPQARLAAKFEIQEPLVKVQTQQGKEIPNQEVIPKTKQVGSKGYFNEKLISNAS
ncbi:hypothetical protein TTHERM_000073241 (macronuclear) [Tetrahymena thermophila SB210]|uniref:Uncharacterized protein n=1 Tax=Tetrahymena thermophila (strain SB210) TaxID=312017 RepID=W7XI91_TETTS|nr:hypothetical protein TTHERM_000073241 [Tetrahymena thermophila SB210]EWS74421.1 hypothetical protein TTHERM_000073241 [Tetrahymena thermophila SB210]|eukprot:XP_012652998.1 hypothetical protein TTHERM_000073241 [Tetrahymena thermophila SB210]